MCVWIVSCICISLNLGLNCVKHIKEVVRKNISMSGARGKSPATKRKSKKVLENEERIKKLTEKNMNVENIAHALGMTEDEVKEIIDELKLKPAEAGYSINDFKSLVKKGLDAKHCDTVVLIGFILLLVYALSLRPDLALAVVYTFFLIAGGTIYFVFDKKHEMRPVMVIMSFALVIAGFYGLCTLKKCASCEEMKQVVANSDAGQVLKICWYAYQAQKKELQTPKVKGVLEGFAKFMKW